MAIIVIHKLSNFNCPRHLDTEFDVLLLSKIIIIMIINYQRPLITERNLEVLDKYIEYICIYTVKTLENTSTATQIIFLSLLN